jgi:hypothetical protein
LEDASGDMEAVQLKSAAKTNPISNRSAELWKTIANWIRAVENKELTVEKTTFHLRLGRPRSGAICELFAQATAETVAAAIEEARNEFFTTKGKLKRGVPADIRESIEKVFAPTRSSLLQDIVMRFQLSFGTSHAYDELLNHLKTKFIDDAVAEDVLLHGLGWVKKEIDNAIENDEPPFISADKFRTEVCAFRDRLNGREYLPSLAGPPSLEQIELQKLRLFVRQLKLVEFSDGDILRGITDFLSARANRVQYAERGYVQADSFREFEDALESLWRYERGEIELEKNEEEVIRGKRLAFRCLKAYMKLQGVDVPADFVRGCFHSLADRLTVGWHPRYELLLTTAEPANGQS